MMRGLVLAFAALLFAGTAHAQTQSQWAGLGCGQLTFTAATALSSITTPAGVGIPPQTKRAIITVETNSVRYRDDGVAPTASVGLLLSGGPIMLSAGLGAVQFIPMTGTAAVNACFYQ